MSAVGVVLAGGLGSRIGGDKALVEHGGVALALHVLGALAAVTVRQAVVAKADTRLPPLPAGVATWTEPALPRHPLTGILHALRSAEGAAVLCCAVDLPLLDAATLQRLLDAAAPRRAVVVPRVEGRLEPLCALWSPGARALLAHLPGSLPMREIVAALDPVEVVFDDPRPFANVNAPEDLLRLPPPAF